MLGRRFVIAGLFLFTLALSVLGPLMWHYEHGVIVVFPSGQDHLALIGVFLAAATVSITAVALVVAVAAIVGYSAIKDAAEKRAEEAADRLVRYYIKKQGIPAEDRSLPSAPPSDGGRPVRTKREENL